MNPTPTVTSPAAPPTAPTPASLEALLGAPPHRPWWRRPTPWIAVAIGLAAVAALAVWQGRRESAAQPAYVTEAVTRGRLALTVTATGTLQPTRKADIGSELSGTVSRVLVDVNDRVRKGQVLAELDTAKLRDQVLRTRAGVQAAAAQLRQAEATRADARATLARLQEVHRLSGGKVPSQAELATAEATLERAEADIASATAGVADARAALSVDETNLSKASIRSPIDGVVLARSVDPGNAVAASLQAVTLFTIAEDLTAMKLQVNVDEADVGRVQAGQAARFTVSAHANRPYPAAVTRVAYGSTIKDNVVTYVADLQVRNEDQSLRPGMTATAVITAQEGAESLLVPNAALRYSPGGGAGAGRAASGSSGIVAQLVPRVPLPGNRRSGGNGNGAGARQVWVLQEGRPVAVPVETGASDGRLTEVRSPALQPGSAVIVSQGRAAAR